MTNFKLKSFLFLNLLKIKYKHVIKITSKSWVIYVIFQKSILSLQPRDELIDCSYEIRWIHE